MEKEVKLLIFALFCNAKHPLKKFLDPKSDPVQFQNMINYTLPKLYVPGNFQKKKMSQLSTRFWIVLLTKNKNQTDETNVHPIYTASMKDWMSQS